MKKMILSMLFAALAPAFCDVPAECTPAPRGAWWPNYFKAMMQREPRDTDLVFLGDSITMMWRSQSGFEGGTPAGLYPAEHRRRHHRHRPQTPQKPSRHENPAARRLPLPPEAGGPDTAKG